jgi:hypothetical protein
MKPTYRIKDWDVHFENHDSRKISNARWFPMPNKHDGKSFRRIAAHRDGVPVFAAWTLLLEVASKMPTRGVLSDEDGPLDADDLAAMTGFPTQIFELAFSLLTQPKVAWLEVDGQESRSIPELPGASRDFALEQNRTEEQGTTKNYKDVGSRETSRSPGSIAQRSAKSCDEEFLEELQRSEAYRMLNVRMLFARMVHWCGEHGKRPTRRRFIAWLNREDLPMENGNGANKPTGYQTATERRDAAVHRRLGVVTELRSRSSGTVN